MYLGACGRLAGGCLRERYLQLQNYPATPRLSTHPLRILDVFGRISLISIFAHRHLRSLAFGRSSLTAVSRRTGNGRPSITGGSLLTPTEALRSLAVVDLCSETIEALGSSAAEALGSTTIDHGGSSLTVACPQRKRASASIARSAAGAWQTFAPLEE